MNSLQEVIDQIQQAINNYVDCGIDIFDAESWKDALEAIAAQAGEPVAVVSPYAKNHFGQPFITFIKKRGPWPAPGTPLYTTPQPAAPEAKGVPEGYVAVNRELLQCDAVREFVYGYEMRADEFCYTPNEKEQAILEDAINGFVAELFDSEWSPAATSETEGE